MKRKFPNSGGRSLKTDCGENYLRRYLDGDRDAFDGVLELYFDRLTFFINRQVRDVHTAEDIAIDTLLELLLHPKRYNFKTSLKTYLFSIAHNKSVNYLKRRCRVKLVDTAERILPSGAPTESESIEIASDEMSLEEQFVESEEYLALSRALGGLPVDMRTAVHLVYFDEMTYKEAATVMKKSAKQLDNLLYRAKVRLKEELSEWDGR